MLEVLEMFKVHEMLKVHETVKVLETFEVHETFELLHVKTTQRFSRFDVSCRTAESTLCSQQCTLHPCTP